MAKKTNTKIPNKHLAVPMLARKYMKDCEVVMAGFPEGKKIEFLEHLLDCIAVVEIYLSDPSKENWDIYAKKENAFLKNHGKQLTLYRQKNIYQYYCSPMVLAEKGIYTPEQWNSLNPEQQQLSNEQWKSFFHLCRNSLYNERDYLLLEQSSADEKEENKKNESLEGTPENPSKKGRLTRQASDKLTILSQEQTVLLMFYLQQEKVFLKDEYLTDMDAGKAFEILTGYSQHTLRQKLSKYYLYQNRENLKEIDHLLTRLKIAVDKTLKEK
ncbi:MAG: hypothetical protein NT150_13855 [Bacteroidetes bacterium]|nr:hypothetical protein [Bacteroidota bacterium]